MDWAISRAYLGNRFVGSIKKASHAFIGGHLVEYKTDFLSIPDDVWYPPKE